MGSQLEGDGVETGGCFRFEIKLFKKDAKAELDSWRVGRRCRAGKR